MSLRSTLIIPAIFIAATSILAGQPTTPQSGVGANIGVRIFYPKEMNTLVNDLFDELTSGSYVTSQGGVQAYVMAIPLKIKAVVYPLNSKFCVEPYGQYSWGPKLLVTSGAASQMVYVRTNDFSVGCNLWIKPSDQKRVQFKFGAGAFWEYSALKVSGDLGTAQAKGAGFGANVLSGIDITFENLAINVDFIVPIGSVEYDKFNRVIDRSSGDQIHYPSKMTLTGFEFRPGVTIHF